MKYTEQDLARVGAVRAHKMQNSLGSEWMVVRRRVVITHRLMLCAAFAAGTALGLFLDVLYRSFQG